MKKKDEPIANSGLSNNGANLLKPKPIDENKNVPNTTNIQTESNPSNAHFYGKKNGIAHRIMATSGRTVDKNLLFILFILVLMIVYIANGHTADTINRQISQEQKELRDLKYQYKTIKTQNLLQNTQSSILKILAPNGFSMQAATPMPHLEKIERNKIN